MKESNERSRNQPIPMPYDDAQEPGMKNGNEVCDMLNSEDTNNQEEDAMKDTDSTNNISDHIDPPSIDEMFSNVSEDSRSVVHRTRQPAAGSAKYDIPGTVQRKRVDIGELGDSVQPGSPEEFVAETRSSLGLLRQILFDHRLEGIRKDHALRLAKQIFEYEYQICQLRLTMSMDIEKRRTFIQYMNASQELQKSVLQVFGRAVEDLGETLFDVRISLLEGFERRRRDLEGKFQQGVLDADQIAREYDILETERERALEEVLKGALQMHQNNSKLLEDTLVLLRDELVSKGEL